MAGGKHLLGMPKGKAVYGTVRVGEKGQIVIPKEARQQFGIGPGDTLLILGDQSRGIIIAPPEVIREAALGVFREMDEEIENK